MKAASGISAAYLSLLLASLTGYIALGYFTPRTEFLQLISLFGFLFLAYFFLLRLTKNERQIKIALIASFAFRIVLLFALPALSDDYFRFIWDGRLSANGINPFSALPSELINSTIAEKAILTDELFSNMNSPDYFTIYPPVLQFIFYLSAKIFPNDIQGSIIVMRLFILTAEAGSLFLIAALLKRFSLPAKSILLYALNPLVIIELAGNLHFEAVMIFFMLLSMHLLLNERFALSAVAFALGVCSKLLPLMFLPLLIKRIGLKRSALFYGVTGMSILLLFVPFLDAQFLSNLFSSVHLYFARFEFNASVYYLIRWAGYQAVGYNVIEQAGFVLSAVALLLIVSVAVFQQTKNSYTIFSAMLFCLVIYFAFATIVHPWYITTLVAFSLFTRWRFPAACSCLIVLTYFTYLTVPYEESMMLVAVEYVAVAGYGLWEWRKSNNSVSKELIG